MTYEVLKVVHHPRVRRIPAGLCESRQRAKEWQRTLRRVLPEVRAGRMTVAIRKVGDQ